MRSLITLRAWRHLSDICRLKMELGEEMNGCMKIEKMLDCYREKLKRLH